jgi:hypothetical protein
MGPATIQLPPQGKLIVAVAARKKLRRETPVFIVPPQLRPVESAAGWRQLFKNRETSF